MKYLIVLAVLASAYKKESCQVSGWGPWTDWNKVHHDRLAHSFPAPVDTGRGAESRQRLMALKRLYMDDQYLDRPTEGRVDCLDGMANDLPCWNLDQLSFVSIADFLFEPTIDERPPGNDLWGWLDPDNGDEYAIMGIRSGTTFVRITDPENPVVVGHLPDHVSASSIWRDIKVIGHYAYIVSEAHGHGMQVFDLHRLRTAVAERFTEDAYYGGFGNCHNIVSNLESGYLYGVGCTAGDYPNLCGGGLHVVDPTDPLNPQYAGCFGDDGYTHDAECVTYHGPDVRYQGREICVAYNEDTMTVVDVTDKNNMVMVSRNGYSTAQYCHQGWFTEDHTIILVDDELDEIDGDMQTKTYIWDMRDLEAPVLMNTFRHATESVDHNMYILGNLVYQSNTNSGLRILAIDQENFSLDEVAYLDMKSTENPWGGSWSVYPYFPSGNIPVTSTPHGLFTVRPDYAAIQKQIEEAKTTSYRMRYREVVGSQEGGRCPTLKEIEYA